VTARFVDTHTGELPISLSGQIANPTTRHLDFSSLLLSQLDCKLQSTGGSLPPGLFALLLINVRKDFYRVVGFAIAPHRHTANDPIETPNTTLPPMAELSPISAICARASHAGLSIFIRRTRLHWALHYTRSDLYIFTGDDTADLP
jgi:hypothetical protein